MFDFLEGILFELKDLPGLSFLRRLHAIVMVKSSRFRNSIRGVQNKGNDLAEYSKRVKRMTRTAKGAKRRED
ncbi:MAG: hypothetical protein IT423_24395 [Pirellulaceae bacterium]|nr:hypothetical protein [Pirellulaceae bacterium]